MENVGSRPCTACALHGTLGVGEWGHTGFKGEAQSAVGARSEAQLRVNAGVQRRVVGHVYDRHQEPLLLPIGGAAAAAAVVAAAADDGRAGGSVDRVDAEGARLHHARGVKEGVVRAARQCRAWRFRNAASLLNACVTRLHTEQAPQHGLWCLLLDAGVQG